jgi:hypothetical protein
MCRYPSGIMIQSVVLYLFFENDKRAMQEKALTRRLFLQHGAA